MPNVSIAVCTRRLGAVPVGDIVGVRDRLAAERRDLVDDRLRGPGVGATAVDGAAEVVDDDLRALRGQLERVAPPDPAPRTGDDRDAPFADAGHCSILGSFGSPSTRSPTMLRCTCAVPPQIVPERLVRKSDCQRSSA